MTQRQALLEASWVIDNGNISTDRRLDSSGMSYFTILVWNGNPETSLLGIGNSWELALASLKKQKERAECAIL